VANCVQSEGRDRLEDNINPMGAMLYGWSIAERAPFHSPFNVVYHLWK